MAKGVPRGAGRHFDGPSAFQTEYTDGLIAEYEASECYIKYAIHPKELCIIILITFIELKEL